MKILDIKESLLNKYFAKTKIQNDGNKGAVCFYPKNIILNKSLFEFRYNLCFAFLQCPSPSKTAIQKNVLKYQKDDTFLNLNKTRSGTRITVRTEDNITVVQQSLEMMKVSLMQKKRNVHRRKLKRSDIPAIPGEFELQSWTKQL